MLRTLSKTVGCLLVLSLLVAPAVLAQDMPGQQQQQAPDVDPSEEEMEVVAEIYLEVEQLQEEYRDRFAEADDPEAAQELNQQLQEEASAIVEEHEGIEVDRYDEIILAAQQDPELRDRLLDKIEEARGDEPAPQPQQ